MGNVFLDLAWPNLVQKFMRKAYFCFHTCIIEVMFTTVVIRRYTVVLF